VTLMLMLVLVGCGNPELEELFVVPAVAEDASGDFVLTIRADSAVVPAGEPIDIETTLVYTGVQPTVEIWGSGGGVVAFSIRQIDGDLDVEGLMTSDCAPHELLRDEPLDVPFQKSGGWDPQDPGSGEIEAFILDPLLRLPPGRWEITARATFLVGECARPEVELLATIVITSE